MRVEEKDSHAEDSDPEVYNEADDEDFNPDKQDAEADGSSSDEEDQPGKTQHSKKRKVDNADDLDSGDEATIRERKVKKRRKDEEEDAGSDDEAGLIKTRSQRLAEKTERKQHKKSNTGKVTIDVDAIWADLASLPVGQAASIPPAQAMINDDKENGQDPPSVQVEKTTKIKRRIKFAGQITEVDEEVPYDSAEAQAYLAESAKSEAQTVKDASVEDKVNRPLRRLSLFEPNPLGIVKGVAPERLRRKAPTKNDILMAEHRAEEERRKKAEKLTTMQKTALDWKGFVVEQGLGDELQEYGKSKKGYLAREQFLDRVHGANEIARRTARLKT